MKLGYFMRGFGVGVIITVVVLSIAFNFSNTYKPSDEEIIEEAKKLGLVEESNSWVSIDDLLEKEQTKDPKESDPETEESETEESETEEPETEEPETKEPETEEPETKETETDEAETETEDSETSQNTDGYARITIKSGMNSEDVARTLAKNNIIDNADDFNRYLVRNKYSTKIRVGSFDVYYGSSYDEIAGMITKY